MERRELAVVYAKGACMGAADAVPGVSGGTVALLTGIYERLVAAITAVSPRRLVAVAAGAVPDRRAAARAAFEAMDGWFLLALGAGVVTAVVTVSRLLDHLLEVAPVPTFGLFFGLIAASALILAREARPDTLGRAAAGVVGFSVAFLLSGPGEGTLGTGLPATAVAGAIAVSAMVLPGISGSLLLLILGQYERLVGTLRAFVDALAAAPRAGLDPAVDPGTTVVAFIGGATVGLLTVAHAVRRALDRWPESTMVFLVSLVIGALRAPVVSAGAAVDGWTAGALAAFAVPALVGGVAVLGADRAA